MSRTLNVIAALLLMAASARGQVRYRPTENGPWRPWHMTAIASARQSRGASAAEVQEFQSRLQELAAILKRAPAVAQPVGFAAEAWGHLEGYGPAKAGEPDGKKIPLAGGVSFGAFPLIEFMRNGKLANEDMRGGETELLQLVVNNIDSRLFSQTMLHEWSGEDPIGFTQPRTAETLPGGLVRIDDVFVMIADKNKGRPPWVPLTLEEAMAPVLQQRRNRFEHDRDVLEKQRREFAEWLTPAKRAERRADWQSAAKAMGEPQGREFLANMEKSEVEIEKHRRATLAPGGPDERSVKTVEAELRQAEAVLPGASRTAPACYDKTATAIGARFRVLAGAPASCQPLVKTNWAFFDATRPRTAPQVLMVNAYARCLTKDSLAAGDKLRGGCTVNRELMGSVDWNAVRAWLNR